MPLELGRGCPFACEFCSTNDFFGRRFRLKSPEVVLGQMRQLHAQYGCANFDLVHDMFTVDRNRVVELCQAMLDSGEGFGWNCSARTDCVDDELIALMARAGCRGIFFGIETGSNRLQRLIHEDLDLGEALKRIRCSTAKGIRTTTSTIVGFPEETLDDLRATIGFLMEACRFDLTHPQIHMLRPLAMTPLHAKYRDELEFDERAFSDFTWDGWGVDRTDRELIAKHRDVFPDFFLLPLHHLGRLYLSGWRTSCGWDVSGFAGCSSPCIKRADG